MGTLGLLFCGGMFLISCRVLLHFQSIAALGDILARLLLSMILLTFFSLLVFSHVITALSSLYLSRDLELLHSAPVMVEEVFLSRAVQTVADSSWMLAVFGIPIFMGYAYVYRPGPLFYVTLLHLGLAMVIVAGGIGILFTMLLVHVFPAQRARDFVALLGVLMGIALYLLFRFLQPERLVNPDAFFTVTQYLSSLNAPRSPYLPTQWIADSLWTCLKGGPDRGFFHEALLAWTTAGATVVVNLWAARALYFDGFSKSQEARKRRHGAGTLLDALAAAASRVFGPDMGAMVAKEVRLFFRDNTQWSQLLLLGALVAVYLYNFSALPLDMSPIRVDFFQNQLAFLNLGLAGFVLSAVSARFVFPAVSAEGEAYWIVQSSPLNVRRFLWGKFLMYVAPLLVLGEILVIFTNRLLDATLLMRGLSSLTMVLMVCGVVAMAVGLGGVYPHFRHQNIAQVATGFGGVTFMIVSSLFIGVTVVLEAGPVYILFMADVRNVPVTPLQWVFIAVSFAGVLAASVLAVHRPMKMAERALTIYG